MKWTKLKPTKQDPLHWYADHECWTFDIYEFPDTGIPFLLKVSVMEETIPISWFKTLDDAQRCAKRKSAFVERILLELFK